MRSLSPKFRTAFLLAFFAPLLLTSNLSAQSALKQSSQVELDATSRGNRACPAAFTADQRSFAQQYEVAGRHAASVGPGQGLTLAAPGRIRSVEVVVHALSPTNRTLLASDQIEPDISRTFHLVANSDGTFSSNIWIKGVTSVRSIEVKSVTYTDGGIWAESAARPCTIVPNPMMLVLSR